MVPRKGTASAVPLTADKDAGFSSCGEWPFLSKSIYETSSNIVGCNRQSRADHERSILVSYANKYSMAEGDIRGAVLLGSAGRAGPARRDGAARHDEHPSQRQRREARAKNRGQADAGSAAALLGGNDQIRITRDWPCHQRRQAGGLRFADCLAVR